MSAFSISLLELTDEIKDYLGMYHLPALNLIHVITLIKFQNAEIFVVVNYLRNFRQWSSFRCCCTRQWLLQTDLPLRLRGWHPCWSEAVVIVSPATCTSRRYQPQLPLVVTSAQNQNLQKVENIAGRSFVKTALRKTKSNKITLVRRWPGVCAKFRTRIAAASSRHCRLPGLDCVISRAQSLGLCLWRRWLWINFEIWGRR